MRLLGHRWRRATVSEVERGRRNVTVSELLALVVTLDVPVQMLLDPRGPVGNWGELGLSISVEPGADHGWIGIEGKHLHALICLHKADSERDLSKQERIPLIGSLPGQEPIGGGT